MAERDLTIRARVEGAEAAKAEVEGLATSTEKLAESQAAVAPAAEAASKAEVEGAAAATTATQAQVAATAELETILETKARVAEQAANVEIEADGRIMEAHIAANLAMQKLGEATTVGGKVMTAALLEARDAVASLEIAIKSAQAIGAPVSPVTLATLAAYDAQIQRLTVSTEAAASKTKVLGAEAALMRDNVAGAARAVASMGGSAAQAALGIGVAIVALDLIPTVIDKIDSKSKELAASLVDLINGLHEEDAAVRKSGESWDAYQARLDQILDTKTKFGMATTAMGAALIGEQTDVTKAIAAWEGYKAAQTGVFEQYPEFVKALKDIGVTFRDTHQEMKRQAELFGEAYRTVLKRDGIDQATAWADANKAVLDRIISDYERAGKAVPPELKKIAASLGDFQSSAEKAAEAHKQLVEKFDDLINKGRLLPAQFEASAAALHSEEAAAKLLAPAIEKTIEDLEKLKLSDKAAQDERDRTVAGLKALIAGHTESATAISKEAEATEALRKKIAEQVTSLDKLTESYTNQVKKIEEARDKSIAAMKQQTDQISADAAKQLAALKQSYDSGALDLMDYEAKKKAIYAAETDALNAEKKKQYQIEDEAQKKIDETTDEYKKSAAEKVKALEDEGVSLEQARKVQKDYAESVKATVSALADHAKAQADVKVKLDEMLPSKRDLSQLFKNDKQIIDDSTSAHRTHAGVHKEVVQPALGDTSKKVSELDGVLLGLAGKLPGIAGEFDAAAAAALRFARAASAAAAAGSQISVEGGGPGQSSTGEPLFAPGGET